MSQGGLVVLGSDSDGETDPTGVQGTYGVFFCMFLRSHRPLAERNSCELNLKSHAIQTVAGYFVEVSFRFSSSLLMTRETTKDQTKTQRDEEKECVAFFCALCRWFSSVASSSGRLRYAKSVYSVFFLLVSWEPVVFIVSSQKNKQKKRGDVN